YSREEVAETDAFLEWLKQDNFVFLGYREYRFGGEGEEAWAEVVEGSGLGILSDTRTSTFATRVPISSLRPGLRERVLGGPLLVVSKTNRESTVHRRVKMDYLGIKQVDASGRIVGELRMIG